MMSTSKIVPLEIFYDKDGSIDEISTMLSFEKALEGRIRITDWFGIEGAKREYPHLNEEQMITLITSLEIGDYDEAIDRDRVREVLDETLTRAGIETYEGEFDTDADNEGAEFDDVEEETSDFKL